VCPVAHPNIRLFITHGGLLSTQEAIDRGVPLLGIPIFGDQGLNMNRAVTAGYGLMIQFNNVTMESLLWGIREMIDNSKYVR
jgi:glucuronosyltransferase